MYSTATTVSLNSGSNPSVYNASVSYLAKITPGGSGPFPSMGGIVNFFANGVFIGSATVHWVPSPSNYGATSISVNLATTGTVVITAVYLGDANFSTSSSSGYNQTVNTCPVSSLNVVVNPISPTVSGQVVTLSTQISYAGSGSRDPSGMVDFYDSGTLIGSASLVAGSGVSTATFSTTTLPVGSHSFKATYSGDNNYSSTSYSNTVSWTVNKATAAISVSSSLNPSALCQSITLAAAATAESPGSGTPTGTMTFKNGTTTIGTGTLSGGVATFTTSSLPQGLADIFAYYGGDSNFNLNSSIALNQTVNAAVNFVVSAAPMTSDPIQGYQIWAGPASLNPEPAQIWAGPASLNPDKGLNWAGPARIDPQAGQIVCYACQADPNVSVCNCACGCKNDNNQSGTQSFGLTYSSKTANAQPIVQATLATNFCTSFPSQIQAQLTWNGTAQPTVTYSPSSHNPGDVCALPLQVSSPVTSTGIFPWSVQVWTTVGTMVYNSTVSGSMPVLVNGSTPFGPGWSVKGTKSIVPGSVGLFFYGDGGYRYFTGTPGTLPFTFTSPPNDQGTLVQNADSSYTYTDKFQNKTNFNSSGLQTTEVDPHGLTTTYGYSSGLLNTIQTPDSGVATLNYVSGLLSTIQQPGNRTATLSYDGNGDLVNVVDPAGGVSSYSYDTFHRMTNQQVGPLNVTYTYGTNGTLTQIDEGLGSVTTLTCAAVQGLGASNPVNLNSAVAAVTDPLGNLTSYTLDPFGRLTQMQTADGALQTWTLDAAGNPTSYIDQLGRITTMTYNSKEDLTQVQYPDNTFATYGYDTTFNIVNQITDALGHITTLTHNSSNSDLLSVKDALGHLTTYTWSNGLKQTITDALGHVTTLNWNSTLRQELSEQNALGFLSTFGYDSAGNRISEQDALGNITTMSFDGNRRMLTRTNAIGGVATWTYDPIGDVTGFTDELGRVTSTVYDQRALPVSVTEALGTAQQRTTTTSYDVAKNPLYVTDPLSDVTSYSYDALNRRIAQIEGYGTGIQRTTTTLYDLACNVISGIDARGTTSSFVYDVRNRLVQKIDAYGNALQRVTSSSYDAVSNLINVTDPISTVTSLGYDALYRQTQRIDAYGLSGLQRTTTTNYDAVSNTVSVINPVSAITSYGYDALYRKTAVIEAQGSGVARTTTINYDAVNNTTSVVNPRGVTTSYSYDSLYRRVASLMAYGTGLQYAVTTVFDAVSNPLSVTNGLNVTTSFGYDSLNRRVSQLDGYGTSLQRTSTMVYDLDDNLTASIDPLGYVVTRGYDALNRLVSVTNPDGGIATTQYDANDNVVNRIDQLGNINTYAYDVLNRGIVMTDALGGIVTLAFDANDNLLSLIDPVANETQWTCDALNRATQELDPLSNLSTATYDAIDRKTSATDRNGQRIAFNYDLLNREISENWFSANGSSAGNLTYTFDSNDNMLTQSWPVSGVAKTSTMTYDSLDRVSTVNDCFSTILTNSYDAASNRTQIQDSFSGITTRTFDALNRMATIQYTGQSAALREDFGYTVRDQVAGQTRYSNLAGTTTIGYSTFTYDDVGRLTNLQHVNGSGSNIANFTNSYDLASRITSEVLNAGAPTTYQYDTTDQLTNDSAVTYTYDLNGNRTMTGYTTGLANEITSDGTWNYNYDKNGNSVQKTNISTGEVFAFGYDNRNRMTTVTNTTTSGLQMQATYVYDALNQRIEKDVDIGGTTTITRFAFDNGQIWVDMNSSNALQTRYLRPDRILELLAQISSVGTATWMLTDRMGSLRNVVDNTGTVIDTITYAGFGSIASESNSANGGTYKYAMYRYDPETGLFLSDMSSRPYGADIGRFPKQDEIGIAGGDTNLFRYCWNNPTNATDPSGTDIFLLYLPSTKEHPVALGHGHMAVLVGADKRNGKGPGWRLYSFYPKDHQPYAFRGQPGTFDDQDTVWDTLDDARKAATVNIFKKYVHFLTTTEDDAKAVEKGDSLHGLAWLFSFNCVDAALSVLGGAGIKIKAEMIGDNDTDQTRMMKEAAIILLPLAGTIRQIIKKTSSPMLTYEQLIKNLPRNAAQGDWETYNPKMERFPNYKVPIRGIRVFPDKK